MDTGQVCAPATRWLCITQVNLIFIPCRKVTQQLKFNMAWYKYSFRYSSYRPGLGDEFVLIVYFLKYLQWIIFRRKIEKNWNQAPKIYLQYNPIDV